jgi:hypothetical protein
MKSGTILFEMGSAPAPGAADDALVVSINGVPWAIGRATMFAFGAKARRTAAGGGCAPHSCNER